MRKLLAILVLLSAFVAACNPSPTPCPECTATAVALVTREARVSATETALAAREARGGTVEWPSPTPTDTPILPTPTPTRTPTPTLLSEPCGPDAVPSWQAEDWIGEIVTVQIDRAYCSYRPDINGSPTFCNDAPYPTHDFTMLVWDQDWSDYDRRCICVYGKVTPYKGKPEIVLESQSDVSVCR